MKKLLTNGTFQEKPSKSSYSPNNRPFSAIFTASFNTHSPIYQTRLTPKCKSNFKSNYPYIALFILSNRKIIWSVNLFDISLKRVLIKLMRLVNIFRLLRLETQLQELTASSYKQFIRLGFFFLFVNLNLIFNLAILQLPKNGSHHTLIAKLSSQFRLPWQIY